MPVLIWLVGGVLGLYGLHRLGLWLEDRGYLYYLRKKPSGGGGHAFIALQQMIEPAAAHVEHVHEHDAPSESRGAAGGDAGGLDEGTAESR